MFELRADSPGLRSVSLTAWLDGIYLGELIVEITAERDALAGPDREVRRFAEMTTEATEGAVSLVVRYDEIQNAYRFEFRDEDNPAEVTSNLAYDPGPLVEQLIAGLDRLAKGRSGYNPHQARDYLREQGADLWQRAGSRTAARAILGAPAPDTAIDNSGRQGRCPLGAALPTGSWS